jgi:hypothetical protein
MIIFLLYCAVMAVQIGCPAIVDKRSSDKDDSVMAKFINEFMRRDILKLSALAMAGACVGVVRPAFAGEETAQKCLEGLKKLTA